jgi:hypothetical protein
MTIEEIKDLIIFARVQKINKFHITFQDLELEIAFEESQPAITSLEESLNNIDKEDPTKALYWSAE